MEGDRFDAMPKIGAASAASTKLIGKLRRSSDSRRRGIPLNER